ncbi:MAG TPA: CpsB/CapC family capsule biosynthesis tyrosine phosphatase [Thermoguttaceae bacterium]|nr:CpsB/CapC family capsule biosynthesis tyrosine phosphatase [Thermoguttaceae bacterium]
MPDLPSLVDIHCHLLPGLDDGAADRDVALAMARLAVADGISTVVATPHQSGGHVGNHNRAICTLTADFQEFLREQNVPLRVLPGAEVRIEPELVSKLRSGKLLTLADRRRHVLLELPSEVCFPLDRLLGELDAAGMVGILAHPERNMAILSQRHLLASLVDAGCLVQITSGSLVGTFGPRVQKFAEWLVMRGLVHFVGSDAHGARTRRPLLRRAFECIARLAGPETAADLCCRNPARVAAGETVTLECRSPGNSRWIDRFWRKRAG